MTYFTPIDVYIVEQTKGLCFFILLRPQKRNRVNKILDEQQLAEGCSKRNREAEDELYRRYAARLFSLCRRYAGNQEDAKDLMQDALVRAIEKISTFKYSGSGSLYAWISRIAVNMALNNLRIKQRSIISFESDLIESRRVVEEEEVEIEKLPQEVLMEIISSLPDKQRAVFNMYSIEEYSHREISELLGISEKGSAGLLAKAKRRIREKIMEYISKTE